MAPRRSLRGMTRGMRALLVLVCSLAAAAAVITRPAPARAEVADRAAGGFTVKAAVTVPVAPAAAWAAFVDVGAWWDKAHTFSGDAANLSLEARPGGCWCEKLPGGGVQHLTVVYADAGKVLRLTGGLGPLQSLAVAGVMSVTFAPAKGGTEVRLSYTVGGYAPTGLGDLAKPVDAVLAAQLERYKQRAGRAATGRSPSSP